MLLLFFLWEKMYFHLEKEVIFHFDYQTCYFVYLGFSSSIAIAVT